MAEGKLPSERTGQVQSLMRAISLLRILSEAPNGATLKQLAAEASLAPSTAHRLLTTLQGERFVRFNSATNIWQVGVGAFGVGSAFIRARDLTASCRPHMERISAQTGETISLYVAAEDHAVCMAQVAGHATRDAIAEIGDRLPLHTSAAGKAILSRLPDEMVAQLLGDWKLRRSQANTQIDESHLHTSLTRAREFGYAGDLEENTNGVICVGAALLDETGYPTAALSISGAADRIATSRLAELGGLVRQAANAVTGEIGGTVQAAE